MSTPLVLTLPAANAPLSDEIKQQLAPYATIQEPQTLGLEEVKLVVEILGGATSIAANAAAVYTLLLTLQDRAKKQRQHSGIRIGRLGTPEVPLEDADDRLLRDLLGLPAHDKPGAGVQ